MMREAGCVWNGGLVAGVVVCQRLLCRGKEGQDGVAAAVRLLMHLRSS
jgi:hypothetical protein